MRYFTVMNIIAVDSKNAGAERSFECDTVLIAVGLDPVDEFYHKAREFGMKAYAAGDAHEIAEASAAMFSGKIQGREIARALGKDVDEAPAEWKETERVLKSKPGETRREELPDQEEGIFPVFHCSQDIPCNPCISVCPVHGITTGDDIRNTPRFIGDELEAQCSGCAQCVTICPGLAVTLVDYRKDPELPHRHHRARVCPKIRQGRRRRHGFGHGGGSAGNLRSGKGEARCD